MASWAMSRYGSLLSPGCAAVRGAPVVSTAILIPEPRQRLRDAGQTAEPAQRVGAVTGAAPRHFESAQIVSVGVEQIFR
jgi:hypothetical protein